MPDTPDHLLDAALLRRLAGEQAFTQGEAYLAEGRVRQLHTSADRATGRVEGARAYRVKLWRSRGDFQFSCTCAAGLERAFCKHCVAVGLAWLTVPGSAGAVSAANTDPAARAGRAPDDEKARETIADHLRTVSPERLAALVLEATDYDDILRRRLLLEAAGVSRPERSRRLSPPLDLAAYRRLLREAIATADYVDYDAMPDYAQGVQEAIAPLSNLLRGGQAAAVVELTEHALLELDKVSDLIDGSDGSLHAVYDDLQSLHLEACRVAHPPVQALAARLLEYELEGGLGVFNNALKTYAEVLGPVGLRHWRQRLVEEWSALPPSTAGESARGFIDHRRYQLRALMERVATAEEDADLLLTVRERDLSNAHDFLSLAELLAGRGQEDAAILRAEEGLRRFGTAEDAAGLRDFLIAAYERVGRNDQARACLQEEFRRAASPGSYRRLREHLQRTAPERWPAWQKEALTGLRARVVREKAAAQRLGRTHPPDGSDLVELLLEEGENDAAWQEALVHGCRPDLWLALASRREAQYPGDALGVLQTHLEPAIVIGGATAYREAIELFSKIRSLFDRLGRPDDFARYHEAVRSAHRQRRGFVKLLDAAGR